MNDDLPTEMHRVAAHAWQEHDTEKPLFGGVVEGNKIYVYKVNGPVSAQSIHEAYRQATRKRLRRQRRLTLLAALEVLIATLGVICAFVGFSRLSCACGVALLILAPLIWLYGRNGGKKNVLNPVFQCDICQAIAGTYPVSVPMPGLNLVCHVCSDDCEEEARQCGRNVCDIFNALPETEQAAILFEDGGTKKDGR